MQQTTLIVFSLITAIGACIIIFSKRLGHFSYEKRGGFIDDQLSSSFRIKKEYIGKITGKLSTYVWLWRIFGILWTTGALFVIYRAILGA